MAQPVKFLLIVLAALCSACATTHQDASNQLGAAQPAAYREGYQAGCDSGYVAAGHPYYSFNKNLARMSGDPLYSQGWADGFAVCKGKYDAITRALR